MKAYLVWVTNRAKRPHTQEQVNPTHLVRSAHVQIPEKEEIIQGFKLEFSNGYSVLVDEKDAKKVIQ